ncbi:MAG: hypothetical protein IE926_01805 [Micrococcales bacterium]|nr:hypothetical protein [Micrococcales bacterium]
MTARIARALDPAQAAQLCGTCDADPKVPAGRYCARFACYCGHEACPAFAFYVPRRPPEALDALNVVDLAPTRRRRASRRSA